MNLIRKSWLVTVIIIILIILIPGQVKEQVSFEVTASMAVIGFASIIGIIRAYNYAAFSLNLIHWLFFLIFFFVSPVVQVSFGYSPWKIILDKNNLVQTNEILICWIIFYCIGTLFGQKIKLKRPADIELLSIPKLALLCISFICAFILINHVGFRYVFTTRAERMEIVTSYTSSAVSLIIDKCTRAAITCVEAIFILAFFKDSSSWRYLFANTIVLFLSCFPLAMSRNALGIIYLGLFAILYYKNLDRLRSSPVYVYALLIGVLIIFPMLNVFRYYSISNENLSKAINTTLKNLTTTYLSVNYDAYAMIAAIRNYVSKYGATHGRQLLGAMLFFIPRGVWKSKPAGSGSMVATTRRMSATNVSCPLPAEGYINFGIIGVVLFAFIIGVICTCIDRKFWENASDDSSMSFYRIVYPFLLPGYFFVLRGDLMSSWAYLFAYIMTFYLICCFGQTSVYQKGC